MKTPKCKDLVAAQATSAIETIRCMLCPEMSDVDVKVESDGSAVVWLGNEISLPLSAEQYQGYDMGQGEGVDHEWIADDLFEQLREDSYDSFASHGLSFDYVPEEEDQGGYFRYQISWGGPSTEFRFFTDDIYRLVKCEFWYLDWFDGACKNVTKDETVATLWDMFEECSAEHAYQTATEE